jgi:hypothetical protein
MRLQILSNCRADGRHLAMGEVADLPQGVANELLAMGMASIAPEPEPALACPPKPRRSTKNSAVAMETASDEELAMPAGQVPTKRGRPVFTPTPED